MPSQPTIPQILQYAPICQYLAANDQAQNIALSGATIDNRLATLIYMERKSVQNRYNLNPNDTTLPATSAYLFSLLGKYTLAAIKIVANQSATKPVIYGPSNQSVIVGATATFSITVTSSTSYTTQWYLNGVAIPLATSNTYSVTNAQLTQSGGQYTAVVTNSVGSTTSLPGTLTVTNSALAYYWFGASDPYPALSGGSDTLTYAGSVVCVNNVPIIIPWPSGAANNQFQVVKYPAAQNVKTNYLIPPIDSGIIPDDNYRAIFQLNGYNYIVTRRTVSLDISNTSETFT